MVCGQRTKVKTVIFPEGVEVRQTMKKNPLFPRYVAHEFARTLRCDMNEKRTVRT
jgi:hypothetical protein